MREYDRDYHEKWGRASLIPECCIQWWIEHDTVDNRTDAQQDANCSYVPCPTCADARTFVEIHHCDQGALWRDEACPGCGFQIRKHHYAAPDEVLAKDREDVNRD